MTPSQAAKATSIDYETSQKLKTAYNKNPEKKIPVKKPNLTPNKP